MKKIMGNLTGKLSLSILTMVVLLVGVLAGLNGTTTTKAGTHAIKAGTHASQQDLDAAKTAISKLPLVFEPNRGQTDSRVKYFARSSGYTVFLTGPSSAVMTFRASKEQTQVDRVTMSLAGANAAAEGQATAPTGGHSNYYIGSDRSKWLENVPHYAKVQYNNVYPGVDVAYQGDQRNFRYDFVVRPGADPKSIRLSYEGVDNLYVDRQGRLVASIPSGKLIASKPYVYQEYGGRKHEVDGRYVQTAKNDVRFEVGRYDASQPLVIDPSMATYATYLSGAADAYQTRINAVAMDGTNVYFTGYTFSPTFDSAKALQPGAEDCIVGKVGLTLTGSITTTFFGGIPGAEVGNGIALTGASSGAAIVITGITSSGTTFPGKNQLSLLNPSEINFNQHVFVAGFDSSVTSSFASILPGIGAEIGNAVAVDSTSNHLIHVTGWTSSPDFLTNIKAPAATSAQPKFQASLGVNSRNAFYIALNTTGTSVTYGSFLGGYGTDVGSAIAVDSKGNAYIAGASNSWGDPTTGGVTVFPRVNFPIQPPQPCAPGVMVGCLPPTIPPSGPLPLRTFSNPTAGAEVPSAAPYHAFLAAFNPNANNSSATPTLLYSLPIGGDVNPTEQDFGTAVTVDANFNVYVGGNTVNPSIANNSPQMSPLPVGAIGQQNTPPVFTGDPPLHGPGTNGSQFNTVFTLPGVAGGAQGGFAVPGPGVVANVFLSDRGAGYTAAQNLSPVTFTATTPLMPGGHNAAGVIVVSGGGSIAAILITNQGFGYRTPPTITIPAPLGAGPVQATGSVSIGAVVLGNWTPGGAPAQDGWVVAIPAPGVPTNTYNGTSTVNPGPVFPNTVNLTFPSFLYGTLVNSDEGNGNGTGLPAGFLPVAGGVNQVTGLVTDAGPVATGSGTAGPIGNVYVSGAAGNIAAHVVEGPPNPVNPALIRRRINTAGFDPVNNPAPVLNQPAITPFSKIFTSATESAGVIQPLGDLNLGTTGLGPAAPPAPVAGVATGVAFDTTTSRSCIGGWVNQALPNQAANPGLFLHDPFPKSSVTAFKGTNPAVLPPGALPNGANDGIMACAEYKNDVTVVVPPITPGGAGPTVNLTMQAGVTPTTVQAGFTALATTNPNHQQIVSVTAPPNVALPFVIANQVIYDPPAGALNTPPASASNAANAWLHLGIAPGGTGIVVSLLDPDHPTNPVPASNLDPGFYQATFFVIPCTPTIPACNGISAGDNAGVPIAVTVNLVVTGQLLTNTNIGGGVAANLTVILNEGGGFMDVGMNTKYLNIPVVSSVPLLSPSLADVVFDLSRDLNTNPVYVNSNTLYPVLGPPTLTGNVIAINISNPGSNYTPNTTNIPLTFSPPPCQALGGTPPSCVTATGTFTVGASGTVTSYAITNTGAGYSNPPTVTFPLPNAGGTQAQATVILATAPPDKQAGGGVTLRPAAATLTPGMIGCGNTAHSGGIAPMGLANSFACYIQVALPPTMLQGAPPGTYTGTFTLMLPTGTLNAPSTAAETVPPSPSTVITFTPATITINAIVGTGGLIVNSPWISNAAPFTVNPPPLTPTPGCSTAGSLPVGNGAPNNCISLAPFAVPTTFNGTLNSNNNNVPYIPTVTGNNPNLAIHTITLDSRNLLLGTPGNFLATVTPGINKQAELAYNLGMVIPIINSTVLIPTCTTATQAIPSSVLQFTQSGILPASTAVATTTEVQISIVNPSALASGLYASTITYAALDGNNNPLLDSAGIPIQSSVPVCLSVGNNLKYGYVSALNGNLVAAGPPTMGFLYTMAGTLQLLYGGVFALGPSQHPSLPNPGGPIFAPADMTVEVPASLNNLPGEPVWIAPPTLPAGSGDQFGLPTFDSGTCHGTMPVNTCTPAFRRLNVGPPQATTPQLYLGGFTVPASGSGLLAANPNPLAATLPVQVSSGPALAYTNPTGTLTASSGSVYQVAITNPGTLYSAPPAIHFLGGCTTEPTAVATLTAGGNIQQILLNTVGAGCTTAPVVQIDPPSTPGGVQATAVALISDATLAVNFSAVAGSTVTVPNQQAVFILPSTTGVSETYTAGQGAGQDGPFFGNIPANAQWLPGLSLTNCSPATYNPNLGQPGFFTGCTASITPTALVQFLPVGTYQGWFLIHSGGYTPAPQPNLTMILATLNVVNPQQAQCSITVTANGTNAVTLPVGGTSNSGYWPSTPLNLTVTPNGACPAWTVQVNNPPAPPFNVTDNFITLVSGANGGVGAGTISYNAFSNAHTYSRTGTIVVTAGTSSATYTITEAANSTESTLQRSVRATYQRNFGREPDTGGFAFWTCSITPCGGVTQPSDLGHMLDLDLANSQEGKFTDFQVLAIYQAILGRYPTNAEWLSAIAPFRVNIVPDYPTTLRNWIQAANSLVVTLRNSQEYANLFAANPASVSAVTALYMKPVAQGGLNRPPTPAELPFAVLVYTMYQHALATDGSGNSHPTAAELISGVQTVVSGTPSADGAYALLLGPSIWGATPSPYVLNPTTPPTMMFTSVAYQNGTGATLRPAADPHSADPMTTNGLMIQMLYYAIMGRDPDPGGFTFWLGVANGGGPGIYFQPWPSPANVPTSALAQVFGPGAGQGFAGSAEFMSLFN